MALKIRTAAVADAVAIQRIYAPIVSKTAISFEEIPPSAEEIAQRIATTLQTYPYLVAEDGGEIKGYAYASQHRARPAYRWAVDVTVYSALAVSFMRLCFLYLKNRDFAQLTLELLSPMKAVWVCTSRWDSSISVHIRRLASSLGNGTTSATGGSDCARQLRHWSLFSSPSWKSHYSRLTRFALRATRIRL